jgi:hypothetical protein
VNVVIDAWQATLAAEQQAVFGYQLLGPRLASGDQPLAMADSAEHEALRDTVTAAMVAAAVIPVSPAADYPAFYPVGSASSAQRLAVRLEDNCAAAWRYLYATAAAAKPTADTTARRHEAQVALIAAAKRATVWRIRAGVAPAVVAFPGI